jgi:hypothetical protein
MGRPSSSHVMRLWDNCSKSGADRLIRIMKAYWAQRGHNNIVFTIECMNSHTPVYFIRSTIDPTWDARISQYQRPLQETPL